MLANWRPTTPRAQFSVPLLAPTLDTRITFTSVAGGSYTNYLGNVVVAGANEPRFNYSTGPLTARGLLITTAQTENASITNLALIGGVQAAMTVYVECYVPTLGLASNPGLLNFDDGTANNALVFYLNDSTTDIPGFAVFSGGINQANIAPGSATTAGTLLKMAASWKTGGPVRFAWNGTAGTEVASATIPTPTRMLIGQTRGGGNYWGAEVRNVTIWGSQFETSQLQALTV